MREKGQSKKMFNAFIAIIGYLLSPLSWWNDLFVNIPLAYLFSLPFSIINKKLFLYAFVIGYWLTNLIGLILLHKGVLGVVAIDKRKHKWKNNLFISLVYTIVIILLVHLGFVRLPSAISSR